MRVILAATVLTAALVLPGCISTVGKVVTAPVRVAAKTADWVTVSQSEKDEKRGREMRKRDEKLGKLDRRYKKQREACEDGNRRACEDARGTSAEVEELKNAPL